MFEEQSTRARSEGYRGLRLVADMDWLLPAAPTTDELVAFELWLDRHVPRLGATIVCAYRETSFDTDVLGGAGCVHPLGAGSEAPQFKLVAGDAGSWRLVGEVDIAVVDGTVAPASPLQLADVGLLATTTVSELPLVVAVADDHPWPSGTVDLHALQDALWITMSRITTVELGRPARVVYDGTDVTTVLELVAALSPTPALGGYPRDAALTLIAEVEGFARGRYGGAVGWVDAAGDGAFAVAIRGAELSADRRCARLVAGGGIVAASDPLAELAETQAKLQAMLSAIVRP